jgi:hypothetical protein
LSNSLLLLLSAFAPISAYADIVVPPDFSAHQIATGANLDIQPGPGGAFGTYVYYIDEAATPNNIMRVDSSGGPAELFASVPYAITLGIGFGGDLFAAEGAFGAVNGDVWRITSDGTVSFFAHIPTFVEGMAFSAGGPFGTKLYVSEFGPATIRAIDSSGNSVVFAGPGTIGSTPTGLEFGPGGAFGNDLYVIDRYGGIFTVDPSGTATPFSLSPSIYNAETLAFGDPATVFGEYLYVAEEGSGDILRISPSGHVEVFASGFSFSTSGVTGLEFSADGETLFVTADDAPGSLYAIAQTVIIVPIDVKPGSDPNCINVNGHGVIPVAVLGSDTFDVTRIDQSSLLFGGLDVRVRGNKGPLCSLEYSNGDAYLDLVCHFEDDTSSWVPGDGEATVTGNLFDLTEFEGTDTICVVP